MNEIENKFLLAGDRFMSDMYLRQPGFRFSAEGTFTTNNERIPKFKETGHSQYIYQNELDKACFQDDMAYGSKILTDLTRKTVFDKILHDKSFIIDKNLKYDEHQKFLASMIFNFLIKSFLVVLLKIKIWKTKN